MQQIFFGKIDTNEFNDTDDFFYHDGEHYWYKLVVEEDQICIHDTCGRHMPIGTEQMDEFYTVVWAAKTYFNKLSDASDFIKGTVEDFSDDMVLEKYARKS